MIFFEKFATKEFLFISMLLQMNEFLEGLKKVFTVNSYNLSNEICLLTNLLLENLLFEKKHLCPDKIEIQPKKD